MNWLTDITPWKMLTQLSIDSSVKMNLPTNLRRNLSMRTIFILSATTTKFLEWKEMQLSMKSRQPTANLHYNIIQGTIQAINRQVKNSSASMKPTMPFVMNSGGRTTTVGCSEGWPHRELTAFLITSLTIGTPFWGNNIDFCTLATGPRILTRWLMRVMRRIKWQKGRLSRHPQWGTTEMGRNLEKHSQTRRPSMKGKPMRRLSKSSCSRVGKGL